MTIVANFDSSIVANSALTSTDVANIEGAINKAVAYWNSQIIDANPTSVHISFGWGEANGNAIPAGAAAQSYTPSNWFAAPAYSTMLTDLGVMTTSATDISAYALAPGTDPAGGTHTYLLSQAQMSEFGISHTAATFDGYVGLNAALTGGVGTGGTSEYTWDGTAQAGKLDAVGILDHEISEVLGRVGSDGFFLGTGYYTVQDLHRYSSGGSLVLNGGPGFLSLNGGSSHYAPAFNDTGSGGDLADWNGNSSDSFGSVAYGVAHPVSALDLSEMGALGFTLASDPVEQTHIGVLRTDLSTSSAHTVAISINNGQATYGTANITSVEGGLLNDSLGYGAADASGHLTITADNVTITQATSYLHMFGGSLNSEGFNLTHSGLTYLTNYAENTLVPDGFSLQNIYLNVFASQSTQAGLLVTPETTGTTAARDAFLDAAHVNVFGTHATAAQLAGWDGSVMDVYAGYTHSEAGAAMSMWGVFQSVADQGTYSAGGVLGSGVHGADYVAAVTGLDHAAHGVGDWALI